MTKFIPEFLSDTTLERLEIHGDNLRVEGTFYNAEKLVAVFTGLEACQLSARWNISDSIDGISVNDDSQLLSESQTALAKYNRPINGLYSFQVVSASNVVVLEIIARSISINGISVDPSILED